jgi:hypothetical protein
MTDRLRLPLFIIAAIVLIITIGMEAGSALIKPPFDEVTMRAQASKQLAGSDMPDDDRAQVANDIVEQSRKSEKPPGAAIPYMAVLDGLVLFAVLLMAASTILSEGFQGRIQGIVTLIVSVVMLLGAIVMVIKVFVELRIMVSLFLAPPFGTLAYLAKWGFFDRGGAEVVLGLAMLLKIVFAILLILAQQRFLQNKGLVLIVLTTLLCTFVISFLHGLVPIILVSITDMISALIVLILVIIWAIVLLIGSVVSVVKVVV